MNINIGDKLPDASFLIMTEKGPEEISTQKLAEKEKIIIVGVPGAFTPTCHNNHLPEFIKNIKEFEKLGVEQIAVISVNDVHVMNAWRKETNNGDKILFLADGNGEFAKKCGLDVDLAIAKMGVRSKRYAMVVEKGTITHLNIEESPGVAEISSAGKLMENMKN